MLILFLISASACHQKSSESIIELTPEVITEKVNFDTDDPAIWYNESEPERSLVLGTDKDPNGALCVFDLKGKRIDSLSIRNLNYPNNVDVQQAILCDNGQRIDIAITVERPLSLMRVFRLPDMKPIDGGGFRVFEGQQPEQARWPMGVAIYYDHHEDCAYVVLSRKTGPTDGTYLWQYALHFYREDSMSVKHVRSFGEFSGEPGEIEAILVDDKRGEIYYSDEAKGVMVYHANKDSGNQKIRSFGLEGFKEDREGIAMAENDADAYIFVSDQAAHAFHVYSGKTGKFIRKIHLAAKETDGIEICSKSFGDLFPNGIFVCMSDDRTFQFYDLGKILKLIRE